MAEGIIQVNNILLDVPECPCPFVPGIHSDLDITPVGF